MGQANEDRYGWLRKGYLKRTTETLIIGCTGTGY